MRSTEEDNSLLCQSQEIGLKESEAEVESVVESVIRGEERVDGSGDTDESDEASVAGSQDGEAVAGVVAETTGRGFGENDATEDEIVEADVDSCPESGSYRSATSYGRHDIDYVANKKGKLS